MEEPQFQLLPQNGADKEQGTIRLTAGTSLKAAIGAFRKHMRYEGFSPHTIQAFGSDTTVYTFDLSDLPGSGNVNVDVKLLFRRAFIDLVDQKDWDVPDFLMENQYIEVNSIE